MKVRFDITTDQWVYVILFTLLGCAYGESHIGWVMLPFWWALAVLGRNS